MSNISINIKVDKETKEKADLLFEEMGLNMSTAINIFLKASLRERAIPFYINANIPNDETIAAIKESETIVNDNSIKGYRNIEELEKALME